MTYVDETTCIGCKNCALVARSTFYMEDDLGRARVVPPLETAGRRGIVDAEAAGQHVEFTVLSGALVEGGAAFRAAD